MCVCILVHIMLKHGMGYLGLGQMVTVCNMEHLIITNYLLINMQTDYLLAIIHYLLTPYSAQP